MSSDSDRKLKLLFLLFVGIVWYSKIDGENRMKTKNLLEIYLEEIEDKDLLKSVMEELMNSKNSIAPDDSRTHSRDQEIIIHLWESAYIIEEIAPKLAHKIRRHAIKINSKIKLKNRSGYINYD